MAIVQIFTSIHTSTCWGERSSQGHSQACMLSKMHIFSTTQHHAKPDKREYSPRLYFPVYSNASTPSQSLHVYFLHFATHPLSLPLQLFSTHLASCYEDTQAFCLTTAILWFI